LSQLLSLLAEQVENAFEEIEWKFNMDQAAVIPLLYDLAQVEQIKYDHDHIDVRLKVLSVVKPRLMQLLNQ
jgi:hypothetical protein